MIGLLKSASVGVVQYSFFALMLVGSAQSSATLIDQGTTTFDTATGYTWLDITESLGLSPHSAFCETSY